MMHHECTNGSCYDIQNSWICSGETTLYKTLILISLALLDFGFLEEVIKMNKEKKSTFKYSQMQYTLEKCQKIYCMKSIYQYIYV